MIYKRKKNARKGGLKTDKCQRTRYELNEAHTPMLKS